MRYALVPQPKWMCSLSKCFYQIKNIEYKISHIQVGMTIEVEVGTVCLSVVEKLNRGSRDKIYRIETGKGRGIRPPKRSHHFLLCFDRPVGCCRVFGCRGEKRNGQKKLIRCMKNTSEGLWMYTLDRR